MGQTIVEKILGRVGGKPDARAGDVLACRPDTMVAYDFPGYTDLMFKQMRDLGIDRVPDPDRFLLFIDHLLESDVAKPGRDLLAENSYHDITRQWAEEQGVPLFEGEGIGHQVCAEKGYGLPGEFVVHFDGHITQLGAHGSLAMGIRRDLLYAWVTGEIELPVPQTYRFILHGNFQPGVLSRDLIHHLIAELGADGCVGAVMLFDGPGARSMSLDGRAALCGMAMFSGATSAMFEPDDASLAYAHERARGPFTAVRSDPDAEFARTIECDLSSLEPQVVRPRRRRMSCLSPAS